MKKVLFSGVGVSLSLILTFFSIVCTAQSYRQPLLRKDCFFGVHFDFHANSNDVIGTTVSASGIDEFLDKVRPDFVEVDSKGHPGIASYPTTVGTSAKEFVKDALKIWREETTKRGTGLYIHYSDLLDKAALQKHPDWAAVNADKQPSKEIVSIFSAYEDSLLIPQLKEIISKYKINGVWLDGGAWAIQADYSAASLKSFSSNTGIKSVPLDKNSSAYQTFLQFQREAFIDYVNKYATSLHRFKKNIQICSNWMYSAIAPVPVKASVDFLSADLPSSQGDLGKLTFDARCYASQARAYHKAWDLMSWGFDDNGVRPVNVLCQEAAEVIAEGGAWQCYFPQNRDASVNMSYVRILQQLASFVRARQPYCQYAVPVKQVAILFSGINEFEKDARPFQYENNATVRNALYASSDNQLPTEVIMEHQLNVSAFNYPLMIVPELGVSKLFQSKIMDYVSNGGTLLLMGTNNVNQFATYAGVNKNKTFQLKEVHLPGKNGTVSFNVQPYALQAGTTALPILNCKSDVATPIASVRNYGKGKIACLFLDQNNALNDAMYEVYKQIVGDVAKQLLSNPIVEVKGSSNVHVTLNSLQKKTIVNLINSSKAKGNDIPRVGTLTVYLRIAKPSKLMLQPGNQRLPFTYVNGVCTAQIPKIALHDIIVAE